MNRWKKLNQEIKKISPPEDLEFCLAPFREAIQLRLKSLKTNNVKIVYREIRANLLQEVRVNLALLDAAAYEEDLLSKK